MAKEKLFPAPQAPADDKREPRERFSDLAAKIFTVPKSEIDKRENEWQRRRKRTKRA